MLVICYLTVNLQSKEVFGGAKHDGTSQVIETHTQKKKQTKKHQFNTAVYI